RRYLHAGQAHRRWPSCTAGPDGTTGGTGSGADGGGGRAAGRHRVSRRGIRELAVSGPFDVLGLPASNALTDDEVQSAGRRIAAATHPDREDGGDAAAFAAAAAAYTLLRTAAGRGEALAEAGEPAGGRVPSGPVTRRFRLASAAAATGWRVRQGRPARLA